MKVLCLLLLVSGPVFLYGQGSTGAPATGTPFVLVRDTVWPVKAVARTARPADTVRPVKVPTAARRGSGVDTVHAVRPASGVVAPAAAGHANGVDTVRPVASSVVIRCADTVPYKAARPLAPVKCMPWITPVSPVFPVLPGKVVVPIVPASPVTLLLGVARPVDHMPVVIVGSRDPMPVARGRGKDWMPVVR